jgi:branched-chain amino acid aminotransferase
MAQYDAATAIVTVPWPRNERGALAGLKTTSYGENVVALAYAHERGGSEAVFANLAGNLCEGTGSNVFYVVEGELRTPTLQSGCLAGVTRALLLDWYGGREVDEPIEVLERASEIFLASTTRDVQPVHTCDGRSYDAPGPVTSGAMRAWATQESKDLDP